MKRVICIFLAVFTVLAMSISVQAVDFGCNVETDTKAVYLENLDTGVVVYSKSADEKMYPASTTKIMTYVVTVNHVDNLDETMVPIKKDVLTGLDPESTMMGLEQHVGEEYSIRDLLYGMMLPSGNDAALVLADYIGNGISGFVDMMNEKAKELGCDQTHFANPHGLHDADHYTTATDLAKIAKYAIQTDSFMEITNTVSYTPARFDQPITNTNYMLNKGSEYTMYYYPNVKGIKTGFTDEAGKCLVTTADKDGFTYLCVALGAPYSYAEDVNYAMLDTASLYDWVFENLVSQTIYDTEYVIDSAVVSGGKSDSVGLVPEKDVVALLPKNYNKDLLKVDISSNETINAPVKKGDAIGTATVRYDDLELGTYNLLAAKDVEEDRSKAMTENVGKWFTTYWFLIVLIAAFLIVVIILLIVISSSKKKKAMERRNARRYRR